VEQGTFDRLNATGGYVSSFNLPSADWVYKPAIDASPSQELTYEYVAPDPNKVSDPLEAEANRRTGDLSIYLYYVNSIGWGPTIIFIVGITAFIFCISFPSKLKTCQ
jgi:ATP-binding cassette subfamily C (CFTR/MRP) protein 1